MIVRKNGDTGDIFIVDTTNSNVEIPVATASTGSGTGALQVAGGAYIGGASYFDNTLTIDSTSNTAFTVQKDSGGTPAFRVNTNIDRVTSFVDLAVTAASATALTIGSGPLYTVDTVGNLITSELKQLIDIDDTEALIVRKNGDAGDILIVDTINSNVEIPATTTSISTTTGALQVAGGVGIAGNVNIGGNTSIAGNLTVSGTTTTVDTANLNVTDNVIVANAAPTGTGDGGMMIKRYQAVEDTTPATSGDVVNDPNGAKEASVAIGSTGNSATTIHLSGAANSSDDYYNGWWLTITSGTGINQVRRIKDYVGATKLATIYDSADQTANSYVPIMGDDFTTTPDNTSVVSLFNRTYVGTFYDESADRWKIGHTPTQNITEFSQIELGVLEVGTLVSGAATTFNDITIENTLTVDSSQTEAFLVRKNADSGDIFTIDGSTTNGSVRSDGNFLVNLTDSAAFKVEDGSNNEIFTVNTSSGYTCVTGANAQARICDTTIDASISNNMAGLELRVMDTVASTNLMPAVKFMADDPDFTTEVNGKMIAAIMAEAEEDFDADTKGATSLKFFTHSGASTTGVADGDLAMTLQSGGQIVGASTESSTSTSTGALQLSGGLLAGSNGTARSTIAGPGYFEASTSDALVVRTSGGAEKFSVDVTNSRVEVKDTTSFRIGSDTDYSQMVFDNTDTLDISGAGAVDKVDFASSLGVVISNTAASTSGATGALQVVGGVGIAGASFFGSTVTQDVSDANAFRVQNGSASNVFLVDTVSDKVVYSNGAISIFEMTRSSNNPTINIGSGSSSSGTMNFFGSATNNQNINFHDNAGIKGSVVYNHNTNRMIITHEGNQRMAFYEDIQYYFTPSNYSGTPGTTGSGIRVDTHTFTDSNTVTSGTAASKVFHSIAAPTLAAANATVTTTSASTFRIAGAPIAGTNQTITNAYALDVASGKSRIAGNLILSGGSASTSETTGDIQISGGLATGGSSYMGDKLRINTSDASALKVENGTNNTLNVNTTSNTVTINDTLEVGTGSVLGTINVNSDDNTKYTSIHQDGTDCNIETTNTSGISFLRLSPISSGTSINNIQFFSNSNASATSSSLIGFVSGTSDADFRLTTKGGNSYVVAQGSNNFGIGTIDPSGGRFQVKNNNIQVAALRIDDSSNNNIISINAPNPAGVAASLAGAFLSAKAATFTATNTADAAIHAFAIPTLANSVAASTTTNAATVYIAGAPAAGTNQTITNAYSLWVDAGKSQFDGDLNVDGAFTVNGSAVGTGSSPSLTTANLVNTSSVSISAVSLTIAGNHAELHFVARMTPITTDLRTGFDISGLPSMTGTFINVYDAVVQANGYINEGTASNPTPEASMNCTGCAIGTTDDARFTFTAQNTTDEHLLNCLIRYPLDGSF